MAKALPFDERPATVNAALALWCGLVAGLVIAVGGFDDPRLLYNGWIRLMTLAATTAALGWALRAPRLAIARRLQLGVALSLVAHTLLAVGLSQSHLRLLEDPLGEENPQPQVVADAVNPPELVMVDRNEADSRPDFDRPVASGAPQLKTDETALERWAPDSVDTPREPLEPPRLDEEPSPLDLAAAASVAPPSLGELTTARATRERPLAEATAELELPELEVEPPSPGDDPQPPRPAPRPSESPPRSRPQLTNTVAPATFDPEIEQPTPLPLTPRRETEAPQLSAIGERRSPLERRIRPEAPTAINLPSWAPRIEEPSSSAARANEPRTGPQLASERRLPTATRGFTIQPPDTPTQSTDETAQAVSPRVETPRPAIPLTPSAPRVRRELSPLAVAPDITPLSPLPEQRLDSPDDARRPPRPSALALARSRDGLAGAERSPNASADSPASLRFPDSLAAGAATRARTTQTELGDASAPSLRVDRPSSRATDKTTAALLPSQEAAKPDAAGQPKPSPKRSAATAGDQEQYSTDPIADANARAGQQRLDVGQPRVVPQQGAGRGTAGGQPEVSLGQRRRAAPSSAAAAPLAALPAGPLSLPEESRTAAAQPPAESGSVGSQPDQTEGAAPRPQPAEALGSWQAGGGPRQPRLSRGPRPQAVPPAAAELSPTEPASPRLAMRDTGRSPALALTRPGRSTSADTPPADTLASASPAPLGLPDELLPRDPSAPAPAGGRPAINGAERRPAAAFTDRGRRKEELRSGGVGQPAPKTEAAVELGLEFLAKLQQDDGRWAFAELSSEAAGELPVPPEEIPTVRADAAATGLALLSLLGAGYDHFGDRYQQQVKRGLDYLVAIQKPSGELFPEDSGDASGPAAAWQVARFYSHGIASIALCEAYGMTGDAELRQPAQRALDYIRDTQVRGRGGWRYAPGINSDLSVTGWQLMALKSGELAGLNVENRTYDGVYEFLESCREKAGRRARFCYNPLAPANDPRTGHGRNPGTVMTSVGLLIQLYLGQNPQSELARYGADHLRENLPTLGEVEPGERTAPARTSTLGNPLRDTYYWYYATQVMFHMQGDYWQAWTDALRPILLDSQIASGPLAGSWDPLRPTPDKWAPFGGRLYVTTMNLLSLEVAYRHLPLYGGVQDGSRGDN